MLNISVEPSEQQFSQNSFEIFNTISAQSKYRYDSESNEQILLTDVGTNI